MKKIIITLILILAAMNLSYSQVKMNFSLANPRTTGGYFMYDLKVTVLAGQTWRVASTNIRINFTPTPANSLAVKADNGSGADTVRNAYPPINNTNGYQKITTTSILSGAAISFNILTFNSSGFYTFSPGTYTLGTLRWTVTPPNTNNQMNFRVAPTATPSVVFDSLVSLTYPSQFTVTDPGPTLSEFNLTEVPKDFSLLQNYPNPFNPKTTIKFGLPKLSFVTLKIYDIKGQEIEVLANQNMEAGMYEFGWDAANYASGIYFYRITAGDFKETMRMVLLK